MPSFIMNSKSLISNNVLKSIFKRNDNFSTKCKICNMEFTDSERTKRHMIKAHTKPKQDESLQ